jgi:outer membrane protein assembly factor BamB
MDDAGQIHWSQPDTGSSANISTQDQVAYLPGNENQIKAVSLKTSQSIWSTVLPESATFSGTAIYKDKLLVGSFEGRLYVLNKTNGTVEWTYDVGAPVEGAPQVIGNKIWVLTEKGKLFRFEERYAKKAAF